MMKVLVAVASKHGSTDEIARHLVEVLERKGLDVTLRTAHQADDLSAFQAVVLGSAVYAGHWMKEATELADRIAACDPQPDVWLFSSGPVGDPPKPDEDPVDVPRIGDMVAARGHRVFDGKLDKSKLGFGERAIVTALRAPEGDFRDWDDIAAWGEDIATALQSSSDLES